MAASNVKLNRTYLLTIETRDGGTIQIKPPFTLEFDIIRKNWGESNSASFKIYNLNETNRNNIRFDQFNMGVYQKIQLDAGYIGAYLPQGVAPGQLTTLFRGNISKAYSVREKVDFITHVEAYDIGFASSNSFSNLTFTKGTSFFSVIQSLMNDLSKYDIQPGPIGDVYRGQVLTRGNTFSGPTVELLFQLTGNGFFVDNGIAYCLGDSECTTGPIVEINSASGLLGTPYLENKFLSFDMLFEPRLRVGQQIFLSSGTAADNVTNREYKVTGLHHKGIISQAVSGEAITTLSCLYGPQGLNIVGTS